MTSSALDAPMQSAAISVSKTSACPPSPNLPVATSDPVWNMVAAAPTLKELALLTLELSVYTHRMLGSFWWSANSLL